MQYNTCREVLKFEEKQHQETRAALERAGVVSDKLASILDAVQEGDEGILGYQDLVSENEHQRRTIIGLES